MISQNFINYFSEKYCLDEHVVHRTYPGEFCTCNSFCTENQRVIPQVEQVSNCEESKGQEFATLEEKNSYPLLNSASSEGYKVQEEGSSGFVSHVKESQQQSQEEELKKLLKLRVGSKNHKRIERMFTSNRARKDVIYKAILRFVKRSYEKEFRSTKDHLKRKKHHSKKVKLTREEVRLFCMKELEQEPSENMINTFIALLDTKTMYDECKGEYKNFRALFEKALEKFNSKILSECFKNKDFVFIFLKFWEKESSWEELTQPLRGKEKEGLMVEAYKYYLEKLKKVCLLKSNENIS